MPNDPDEPIEAGTRPRRGEASGKWLFVALAAVVVVTPALTWAVSEFVLIPRMRSAIEEDVGQMVSDPTDADGGHGGVGGPPSQANNYRFENLVVNLAGTMGTRYLKVSFLVAGADDSNLRQMFVAEEIPLRDTALGVLSSLTLADLEEVGARNFIRERLVRSFNQTLGKPVAEQIYFLDFVVQ